MIQIQIDQKNGLSVSGHAITGAPPGQNIVCAAVSALTLTLIEGLREVASEEIMTSVKPGDVRIRWGRLSHIGEALLDTYTLGIQQILENYGHITLSII